MFKHVVCQKFHDKKDAQTAAVMLRALPAKIPELVSMEAGINELETERSYDLVLIATFSSIEGLHAYDQHEAHKEVRAFIKPRRSGTVSVDFTTEVQ
ncbi:Dabb family protein [Christensenellaceae bacterium OttesenSCG-928-M15]|nr:Dabb family protein [Christensenellaceae bacterium OttesenSCG-928-M15]